MNASSFSRKLLDGYVRRWGRRTAAWDRRDVHALEHALRASAPLSDEQDAKLRAAEYLTPLRSQIAMLRLIQPDRDYSLVAELVEHLWFCTGCRAALRDAVPGSSITAATQAVRACASGIPATDVLATEYRRRGAAVEHLRELGLVPQLRSGEIYLTERQLRRLDTLVLRQAAHLGPSRLLPLFNEYIADSGISFGGGTILRVGQFMPPLLGEGQDMAPLGLIYRVLFRCRSEMDPFDWEKPAACEVGGFISSVTTYARVLAPQYPSQHAMTPASPEHVVEIFERARMLDVVYGLHQHHDTAFWPLIDHAYDPEVPKARLAAARRVSTDLLARAQAREWSLSLAQYREGLNPEEADVFDGIVEHAERWSARDDVQFPVLLAGDDGASLPSSPLLCATLFSYVTGSVLAGAVDSGELGQRLEVFVDQVLRAAGATTIRGEWRAETDSGDIDAGFVTDTAIIVFECKKSCQSFWGRVQGGGLTVDHFVGTLGRGVLQGLRLRRALQDHGAVTVVDGASMTELRLEGREYVHFVLTGVDDGCLQANVFFRSILFGLYNVHVAFTPEGDAAPSKTWAKKQKRTNRILSQLTAVVVDTLPRYGNEIDRFFRNLCAMPLGQLTFAASTLPSVEALERCLRARVAVQNAQAGPHQDFYDAYRFASGDALSSHDAQMLEFCVAHGKLWMK